MDYEQKYNKLVNAIKVLQETNPSDEGIRNWVNDNVPELVEGEDERIRKAIHIYLDWLDGRKDCAPRGKYSIRDMVAWLEKQGKHKSAWTETDDEEFEIAINALKGAGQYDFAAWLITLKKRK